jgi:capsule polysaccharide export protein KpsE/RkpR
MNPGYERQNEADTINAQVVEGMRAGSIDDAVANDVNQEALKEPTIADLQAQLDALRARTPEDDVRIAELRNRIDALRQNIN